MDLSKAFDTINYDLLITKFHAYKFANKSLSLIKNLQTVDREQKSIRALVVGRSCF